jgi:D-lactate dehydrogenase (cytochrome)
VTSADPGRFLTTAARTRVGDVVAALKDMFGPRLSTVLTVREQHGRGEALDAGAPPDAVVYPESTAEVSRIVTLCAANDVPVIPYGAGTSVEGHVSAPYGGICIDVSRMNQVLAVHAEDGDCVVQPGITRGTLNAYLRDSGLFFPVDPGAADAAHAHANRRQVTTWCGCSSGPRARSASSPKSRCACMAGRKPPAR